MSNVEAECDEYDSFFFLKKKKKKKKKKFFLSFLKGRMVLFTPKPNLWTQ